MSNEFKHRLCKVQKQLNTLFSGLEFCEPSPVTERDLQVLALLMTAADYAALASDLASMLPTLNQEHEEHRHRGHNHSGGCISPDPSGLFPAEKSEETAAKPTTPKPGCKPEPKLGEDSGRDYSKEPPADANKEAGKNETQPQRLVAEASEPESPKSPDPTQSVEEVAHRLLKRAERLLEMAEQVKLGTAGNDEEDNGKGLDQLAGNKTKQGACGCKRSDGQQSLGDTRGRCGTTDHGTKGQCGGKGSTEHCGCKNAATQTGDQSAPKKCCRAKQSKTPDGSATAVSS